MIPYQCPVCKADLKGEPIKPEYRGRLPYSHYSRAISVVNRDTDKHSHWKCPDCAAQWTFRTAPKIPPVREAEQ